MAKVSQDGCILPLGERGEAAFKWMCCRTCPATMLGKTWLLISKHMLSMSSTFSLWITKKHSHIWHSYVFKVFSEVKLKCSYRVLPNSNYLDFHLYCRDLVFHVWSGNDENIAVSIDLAGLALESMQGHKPSSCMLVSYTHLTLVPRCCVYVLFLSSLLSTFLNHISAYLPGWSWFFNQVADGS